MRRVHLFVHRSWYCQFHIKRINERTYSVELVEATREWRAHTPDADTNRVYDDPCYYTREMRYVPEHAITARREVTSRELKRLDWWRATDRTP